MEDNPKKIFGWAIYRKKNDGKWYAGKRICGKVYNIYLGKSTEDAEERIVHYCEKKGIKPESSGKKTTNENVSVSMGNDERIEALENRLTSLEQENLELRERNRKLTEHVEKLVTLSESQIQAVQTCTDATKWLQEYHVQVVDELMKTFGKGVNLKE